MRWIIEKWAPTGAVALAVLSVSGSGVSAKNSAYDERGDVEGSRAADLRRLSLGQAAGGLEIHILTAGLLEGGDSIEYRIAIDADDSRQTGGSSPGAVTDEFTFPGVDLVLVVRVDAPPPECGLLELPVLLGRASTSGASSEVEGSKSPRIELNEAANVQAIYRTTCMATAVFNSETQQYQEARVPTVQSLTVKVPAEVLVLENAFRIQVAAKDLVSQSQDFLPTEPEVFSIGRR